MWLFLQLPCTSRAGVCMQGSSDSALQLLQQAELHAVTSADRRHMVLPTGRQNHLTNLLVLISRKWGRDWSRRNGWVKPWGGIQHLARQCVHYLCFTNFCDFKTVFAGNSSLALHPLKSTGFWANWTSQAALFSVQIKAPRQAEKVNVSKVTWEVSRVFGSQSSKIQPRRTHLSLRIFMTHGLKWILKCLAEKGWI